MRRWGNRIVSCDRCQEACPRNSRSKKTGKHIPRFDHRYRESPALIPLLHLDETEFSYNFKYCDIIDNSFSSFRRNIITALGNLMDPVAVEELEEIYYDDPVVSETRDWDLGRIESRKS